MPSPQWSPVDALKSYGLIYLRKMGFIALGWIPVFFISQPLRHGAAMLFAPVIGCIAGLIAGWYMATDSVEDSNMHGLFLWVLLVVGSVLPMWVMEGIMHLLLPSWTMEFGGFMLVAAGNLMALAASVWHASSQE